MRITQVWSLISGAGLFLSFYWICVQFGRMGLKNSKIRFLVVGVFGGIAGVISRYQQERMDAAVTLLFFLTLQMLVTTVDLDTMEIPDRLVAGFLLVGIVSLVTMPGINIISRILGIFIVSVPLFAITCFIPDAFGGGDIKLMAGCGFFLGWKLTLLALSIGVLTGGGYGIWLLLSRKKERKDHFAFGPFLSLGMICSWFFGESLLQWYLSTFWIG